MNLADEIHKLQELHQGGALTDEEFAKAKEAVLSQRGSSGVGLEPAAHLSPMSTCPFCGQHVPVLADRCRSCKRGLDQDSLHNEETFILSRRYNYQVASFAVGLTGVALVILGVCFTAADARGEGQLVSGLGCLVTVVGLGFAMLYKGRSWAWALIGLIPCGIFILFILALALGDKNREKLRLIGQLLADKDTARVNVSSKMDEPSMLPADAVNQPRRPSEESRRRTPSGMDRTPADGGVIHLACSSCRRRLRVRHQLLGRRIRCPGCQALIYVSGHAEDGDDRPSNLFKVKLKGRVALVLGPVIGAASGLLASFRQGEFDPAICAAVVGVGMLGGIVVWLIDRARAKRSTSG